MSKIRVVQMVDSQGLIVLDDRGRLWRQTRILICDGETIMPGEDRNFYEEDSSFKMIELPEEPESNND